MRCSERLRVSR